MKDILFVFVLYFIAQSAIWFQTNGQFISDGVKNNPLIFSLLGVPISYVFIKATYYSQIYFQNLWSGRMIGFSIGIITFSFLTWYFMGETLNLKILLTLILACLIMIIQIFF